MWGGGNSFVLGDLNNRRNSEICFSLTDLGVEETLFEMPMRGGLYKRKMLFAALETIYQSKSAMD